MQQGLFNTHHSKRTQHTTNCVAIKLSPKQTNAEMPDQYFHKRKELLSFDVLSTAVVLFIKMYICTEQCPVTLIGEQTPSFTLTLIT
jgi:hypothetical protein